MATLYPQTMIPGQTIMIYGNAMECTRPQGMAKTIQKLSDGNPELWEVEFLDMPGLYFNVQIKKI